MSDTDYDELRECIKKKFIEYYYETYHINKGEFFDCFGKDEKRLMEIAINETTEKILRLRKNAKHTD